MSRQVLVYDADLDCLVPKYGRNYFARHEKHADLPCPAMHTGGMPAIKSMADGRIYDTKRNYYKSVARAGCEVVGPDKRWMEHIKPPEPYGGEKAHDESLMRDIKKAIEIEAGKVPSYGPESRRLMRRERRRNRESVV
jgi:hypothetical protein